MRRLRLTQVAKDDLHRLFSFIVERELNSSTPNWETPELALSAIRIALDLLPGNSFAGRKVTRRSYVS